MSSEPLQLRAYKNAAFKAAFFFAAHFSVSADQYIFVKNVTNENFNNIMRTKGWFRNLLLAVDH